MKPTLCILTLSLLLPACLSQAAESAAQSSIDTSPSAALRPRVEPAPQQQGMLDLARALSLAPETEANWLETNSDRSLTLYQPANQAEPAGAVVLLPDEHSHPDWPQDLHPLRTGLARHGWDTLSIALPPATPMPVPPRSRTDAADPGAVEAVTAEADGADAALQQTAETQTQESAIPPMELYAQRVIKICEAAIRHLESRQRDYLIFLGSGTGATWAALCAREFQQSHPLGLTLLNARHPATPGAPQITQLLAELDIPVLDIYQTNAPAAESARLRTNSARRAALQSYHASQLPGQLPDDAGALLLREVRGRIQRYLMPRPLTRPAAAQADEQQPGR